MNGNLGTGTRAASLALALGAALGGCGDLVSTQPGTRDAEPAITFTEPGIYPVLVLAAQTGDSVRVELHLKRVRVQEPVASFQGELRFNAARLRLAGARVADGILGATHETAPGTLRFAGASPGGVEGSAVVTLTFATRAPVRADDFELDLEEIVGGAGFQDLAPRLREAGPHPRLSRVPLP